MRARSRRESAAALSRLDGKVGLYHGRRLEIRRAAARLFAAEGARASPSSTSCRRQPSAAHEASPNGDKVIAIKTDVTDPDSMQAAVQATVRHFGKLNVVYNNAGGSTKRDATAVECCRSMNSGAPSSSICSVPSSAVGSAFRS